MAAEGWRLTDHDWERRVPAGPTDLRTLPEPLPHTDRPSFWPQLGRRPRCEQIAGSGQYRLQLYTAYSAIITYNCSYVHARVLYRYRLQRSKLAREGTGSKASTVSHSQCVLEPPRRLLHGLLRDG